MHRGSFRFSEYLKGEQKNYTKGPFIFNEVGGGGLVRFRGAMRKTMAIEGGHPKNIREKGGVRRNILLKL